MPLDLRKVITQLKNLEKQESRDLRQQRLDSTFQIFQFGCQNQNKLIEKLIETNQSKKANFFYAVPDSDNDLRIDSTVNCNKDFSKQHITLATDGSQINPSSHEFTSASLINIGLVAIPYFSRDIPVMLSSEPTTYSDLEEINPLAYKENVLEEDLISYERTLKEVEELVVLAKKYINYKIPIIALLDGTLIHWHIEKFNNKFIEHFVDRFSKALLELKTLNIPVASVLSNSRSNDLINMLRIFKCPYESVDCKKYCSGLDSRNLPCNPTPDYKPVLDRRLIEKHFTFCNADTGSRTILFKSNSKILDYYPDDLKVSFFYMNTGGEIARVELPSYVAKDNQLLGLLHNVVALQCKLGFGYPIALSEAHLQAVVNKSDRQVFYDLLKKQVLENTKTPIKLSSKELRKRISFV